MLAHLEGCWSSLGWPGQRGAVGEEQEWREAPQAHRRTPGLGFGTAGGTAAMISAGLHLQLLPLQVSVPSLPNRGPSQSMGSEGSYLHPGLYLPPPPGLHPDPGHHT